MARFFSSVARTPIRPRRSALFMPGSNARALEKARVLPADCLILDLEDAVAPDKKELARSQVCAALEAHRHCRTSDTTGASYGPRELIVRVNALSSSWGEEDVERVVQTGGADAILLPKVECAEDVHSCEKIVSRVHQGPNPPPIWLMIETPLGVIRAEALAAMHQVTCLIAGTSDLAAELMCDGTYLDRMALLPALSQIVMAARAHGKVALDGVQLDFKDVAALERSCVQGRALGFDGKTLIHPTTIAAANLAFAPSRAEIEHAQHVIRAFEEAAANGSALVVLEGKLVEELHVRASHRVLLLAESIAARGGT